MSENTDASHREIVKSIGIIGGAQIVGVIMGIVRTKIVAVLLGPIGVGIIGLFQSTLDLIRSVTGMGISFSAVKDVAEANGSNNLLRIAIVITIIRRWAWFTGLMGTIVTLVFCKSLSIYAFGDEKYTLGIAILSITLLFSALSLSQLALLQGLRRISSLAKAQIYGTVLGFCISIPLYWILGTKGIVPAFFVSGFAALVVSWWFTRRIEKSDSHISVSETITEGLSMIKLGFFTVITGLASAATLYLVRVFLSQRTNVEGVGYFQAAWMLSYVYLAAILNGMGADYFPRLSALKNDKNAVNKLANDQIEIGLLIAAPLVVGMISFVGLIISFLYSPDFEASVSLLRWQLSGAFLKVIIFPLTYLFLVKNRGFYYIFIEVLWDLGYLLIIYFSWSVFKFEITGIAYLIMYFVCLIASIFIGVKSCDFDFSGKNLKYFMIFSFFTLLAFLNSLYGSGYLKYTIGILLFSIVAYISFLELKKTIDVKKMLIRVFGKRANKSNQ
jgi:antigen flippase